MRIKSWYSNDMLREGAPRTAVEDQGVWGGWPEKFPTVSLANEYLVVDDDGIAKKWDETSYYQNFVENGGSVDDAIYKNRDQRFYASFIYDSSKYHNSIIYIRDGLGGNGHWYSPKNEYAGWFVTKTGYYFRKGVYEIPNVDIQAQCYIMLRLGRSYLNYAEALLRTNDVNGAIEIINKTRQIHGGLPEIPTGTPIDKVWELYKIERRCELFNENDRYWSLLRWAKAEGKTTIPELSHDPVAINIAEDGKSFEFIPLPANRSENSGLIFSERRFLLPVPEGERQPNPNLDQNPGW